MNFKRSSRFAFLLAFAIGVAAIATADEIPRTPSGKPDFSGNYDVSTLTPIERSPALGDRLHLTEEEAERIRAQEAARTDLASRPSDPDRDAPRAGASVGGYNYFFMDRGTSAVKVGGKHRTSLLVDPPNGRFPPMTERGKARREGIYGFFLQNQGMAWWRDHEVGPYDGPESLSIADRCIFSLEGTIPIYPKYYNNLKTVVQTDTHLMILIEWMHYARIIPISPSREEARHAPSRYRSRAGDSVAWWEGETLVIETTQFRGGQSGGTGPNMHLIERLTRRDPDTVAYEFTVTDPTVYTAPYTVMMPFRRTDQDLFEYACHEGNYGLTGILAGARRLESLGRELRP